MVLTLRLISQFRIEFIQPKIIYNITDLEISAAREALNKYLHFQSAYIQMVGDHKSKYFQIIYELNYSYRIQEFLRIRT